MSDPFETLKNLADEPAGPALPAAEVRRRGDRARRRRIAVRAVGAACAVAVITTGGIALGGDPPGPAPAPPVTSQSPAPVPTEEPSPDTPKPGGGGQALTIPDDFPFHVGFPNQDVDTDRQVTRALGTPRSFDPCHDNAEAAAEDGRSDYRRVTQTGPAYAYSHELVVYESSSAADEAMLLARSELERCSQYAYDDGVSRDVWEPSPVSSDRPPADDAILAVSYGYGEYGPSTLATSWTVMRVGNAVLSLSHDGEFGASPESVRIVTRDELSTYRAMAPSLCPFADEATDIGCGAE